MMFCKTCNGWGTSTGCLLCGRKDLLQDRALQKTDFAIVPVNDQAVLLVAEANAQTPTAALSRRPSSDEWIVNLYRGKATRNVLLRALAWPWRAKDKSPRQAITVALSTLAVLSGFAMSDLSIMALGGIFLVPYGVRAYFQTAVKLGEKINNAIVEEIDRLATKDGNQR